MSALLASLVASLVDSKILEALLSTDLLKLRAIAAPCADRVLACRLEFADNEGEMPRLITDELIADEPIALEALASEEFNELADTG